MLILLTDFHTLSLMCSENLVVYQCSLVDFLFSSHLFPSLCVATTGRNFVVIILGVIALTLLLIILSYVIYNAGQKSLGHFTNCQLATHYFEMRPSPPKSMLE